MYFFALPLVRTPFSLRPSVRTAAAPCRGRGQAGPAADDGEEIAYGTIDLEAIICPKLHHDVAGKYNCFDVLALLLNRAPLAAIREVAAAPTGIEVTGAQTWLLIEELRRRVGSASAEELRGLVESFLASLPPT